MKVLKFFFLFFPCLLLPVDSQKVEGRDFCPTIRKEVTQSPTVLFDAFEKQVWTAKNAAFTGYSSLNLFRINLGYHIAENHQPCNEALMNPGPETLFIIGVTMEAQFTEDEIKHTLDFVGRGGKVLVIAEHDNQYGSSDFLRPIINAGG